ncbi:MAG: CRISPR-associated protein Cas4 [Cytophagaceae bacterium]|jgi:CRISPR-associated exonuclease Cas4|nr:CRISPR-associated protein Cas4 [Cytophagaceae bacterium]
MQLTATHINYFYICLRKLWLFANGIGMEHTSDLVAEGKQLHEHSYSQRSEKYKEIEIGGSKIDYYDAKNKVVHEIKKSPSKEVAHVWQVKYYLWLLEQQGVQGVTGILEYPKLRTREEVFITDHDRHEILILLKRIEEIIESENIPERISKNKCKNCSYYDFCWVEE